MHTHTTYLFNGPFPGLPGWAGTRKVKPIWMLLKQETVSGNGISWAVCKSAPCSREITTPAPHHSVFTGRMLYLLPNQQHQSTEGNKLNHHQLYFNGPFSGEPGSACSHNFLPSPLLGENLRWISSTDLSRARCSFCRSNNSVKVLLLLLHQLQTDNHTNTSSLTQCQSTDETTVNRTRLKELNVGNNCVAKRPSKKVPVHDFGHF